MIYTMMRIIEKWLLSVGQSRISTPLLAGLLLCLALSALLF